MAGGPRGRPPEEFDLERFQEQVQQVLRRLRLVRGSLWLVLVLAVVVVWGLTGIYTVGPGEVGVVRRFGAEVARAGPGIHYHLPGPIERADKVNLEQSRRMELGFRTRRAATPGAPAVAEALTSEARMITGDLNIVDVQLIIRYRIKDPSAYLFRVWDPGMAERGIGDKPDGRTLMDVTEAALRQAVGNMNIDDVLTEQRALVETQTRDLLQTTLDSYNTGIQVLAVELQTVQPPDPVQDAFNDVVKAKEDREKTINQANAYMEDILPKARGEAERVIREAEGYKAQRTREAQGEAARFLSVLKEYREAKEVTRRRLYLEAMEEILPGIRKFIVSPEVGGNLLPFLPLQEPAVAPSGGGQ